MLPTFIGIGGQRCGSSWLNQVLSRHPQVQMSRKKELHYFDERMLRQGLHHYEDCFEPRDPARPVLGEITPSYSVLKPATVRVIHDVMPDLRVVFVVRNPIDRTWSQVRLEYGLMQGRDLQTLGLPRLLMHLERQRTRYRTDHARTLRIWREVFGHEAVHVSVYDDLAPDPRAYLRPILAHIGADPDWEPPAKLVKRRVWASPSLQMPPYIRWHLARTWLEMVRDLDRQLGGRVAHWVDELADASRDEPRAWRTTSWVQRVVLAAPERALYGLYDRHRDRRLARRADALRVQRRVLHGRSDSA